MKKQYYHNLYNQQKQMSHHSYHLSFKSIISIAVSQSVSMIYDILLADYLILMRFYCCVSICKHDILLANYRISYLAPMGIITMAEDGTPVLHVQPTDFHSYLHYCLLTLYPQKILPWFSLPLLHTPPFKHMNPLSA